jgi:hypothetical protein
MGHLSVWRKAISSCSAKIRDEYHKGRVLLVVRRENKLPIFAVELRAECCSGGEVDSRGRREYGFAAQVKLKSEILVDRNARSTNDSRCHLAA